MAVNDKPSLLSRLNFIGMRMLPGIHPEWALAAQEAVEALEQAAAEIERLSRPTHYWDPNAERPSTEDLWELAEQVLEDAHPEHPITADIASAHDLPIRAMRAWYDASDDKVHWEWVTEDEMIAEPTETT